MKKGICFLILLLSIIGCSNKQEKAEVIKEDKPADIKFIEENEPDKNYLFAQQLEEEKESSGSLWGNKNSSIYSDRKARKIGDIVTLLIEESASATQSASNSRDKSGKIDGKAGTGFLNLIPEMGAEGSTELSNTGSSSRSNTFSATISAQIRDIDPYGNLFVVGQRNVLINNEVQEINISGYVRPNDIGTDNTVRSTYLANAKVQYNGKLVFDGKAEPGMLSNFLSSTLGMFF